MSEFIVAARTGQTIPFHKNITKVASFLPFIVSSTPKSIVGFVFDTNPSTRHYWLLHQDEILSWFDCNDFCLDLVHVLDKRFLLPRELDITHIIEKDSVCNFEISF